MLSRAEFRHWQCFVGSQTHFSMLVQRIEVKNITIAWAHIAAGPAKPSNGIVESTILHTVELHYKGIIYKHESC